MTPEERQLITGLFDRMRGFTLSGKDGEAEALIKAQVGGLPDAPYMLVQSVLVQEHALQQADARIKALEEQVRSLQEVQQQAQAAPSGGSSFLGGLFGGSSASTPAAERGASVPAVGSRATPSVYGGGQSAWGGGPQPQTQQTPWTPAASQAAPAGGGFLRSAMTTAAGVAGGMLAANAISSWLGGSHATAGSTSTASTPSPQQPQAAATEPQQTTEPTQASHEAPQQHEHHHDTSYQDDGGWFGGDGGGDFDI
jgi:hypothetical protein